MTNREPDSAALASLTRILLHSLSKMGQLTEQNTTQVTVA